MLSAKSDLEEIMEEMRIDSDDKTGVKRAVIAATGYIKGAIGKDKPSFYTQKDTETDELLNVALIMLSDHYYTTRSATVESANVSGTLREVDLGFTSIILQLKAAYLSFEEGDVDGG